MGIELQTRFEPQGEEDASLLEVRGRVTYREAPALRRALFDAIDNGSKDSLAVDLSEVERMDTAGLAVLIEALLATRGKGPEIRLCRPSDQVRRVFQLAAFVRLVSEVPTAALDEALRRCRCWEDERPLGLLG
jgi:anti-sigma B factor antagonist